MANPTLDESTIRQLLQTRDFHVAQARRIDDALALLKDVGRLASKTTKMTGRVAQRAAQVPRAEGQPSAIEWVKLHGNMKAPSPKLEVERLSALAASKGFSMRTPGLQAAFYAIRAGKSNYAAAERPGPDQRAKSPVNLGPKRKAASSKKWKLKKARMESGDTVTNRIRVVFASKGTNAGPLTRQEIQTEAQLHEIVNPRFVSQSAARVLSKMVDDKELKQTKDGWVAHKLGQIQGGPNGAAQQSAGA